MIVTESDIEAGKSKRGGFTRSQLSKWGVNWPPRHGWRRALIHGIDPNKPAPVESSIRPEGIFQRSPDRRRNGAAEEWPELGFSKFYWKRKNGAVHLSKPPTGVVVIPPGYVNPLRAQQHH